MPAGKYVSPRFILTLPGGLDVRLREAAAAAGVSQTEFLRMALREKLGLPARALKEKTDVPPR